MGEFKADVVQKQSAAPAPGILQRKCNKCKKKEKEKGLLQRTAMRASPIKEVPPIVNEVLRSPGQPLDIKTRVFMEQRFEHDFSRVRVHTDTKAAKSARAVDALAYTVGRDIAFGTGQFKPETTEGKNLLAHELTHVLQQSTEPVGYAKAIGPTSDEYEQTADDTAKVIMGNNGKLISLGSKAHGPIGQRAHLGSGGLLATGRKAPIARLQRKGNLDEELYKASSGDKAIDGGGADNGSSEKTGCTHVQKGLGKKEPTPSCPKATHTGTTELRRFNFCLDSDELVDPGQLQESDSLVKDNHPSTRFLVHGYASPEGDPAYNFRLACHRANRVAEALKKAISEQVRDRLLEKKPNQPDELIQAEIKAEIQNRIETASQGPTNEFGALEKNRVAVVYGQIPGGKEDDEPSCKDAPRNIGDIKPEINCDAPTVDLTKMSGSDQLTQFHFCLDSDVLSDVPPSEIWKFARMQAASAKFVVHGFASIEGKTGYSKQQSADYNKKLSCHRALRVARELTNAGVKPEEIREVSGLGQTQFYGKPEFNRVVTVLAESGEIEPLEEKGPKPAVNNMQKQAIIDEARERLISGQYKLAADAYISFWTCGRTATIRQAVERLNIRLPKDSEDESTTDRANGEEEGNGVNVIRLSNVALRANNPIKCTMGRIIDMAFHHSVVGDSDLDDLAEPSKREPRHLAGLHLIDLAGLKECEGGKKQERIDKPRNGDPRADKNPPICAEAPQPTRLHPPVKGAKERETPLPFNSEIEFSPRAGSLTTKNSESDIINSETLQEVIKASAEVSLGGRPDVFSDYEIGFIQTIIDDMMLSEYVTGHRVYQKLPVPIRAAHMRNGIPVPEPWMAIDAMTRPDSEGHASLTSSWRLNTEWAQNLNYFKLENLTIKGAILDTWLRHTSVALWLVTRRLGAPLDRFSIDFLDGLVYNVDQNLNLNSRRTKGRLDEEDKDEGHLEGIEWEQLWAEGTFRAFRTSDKMDPRIAQLHSPVSGEIDLNRQIQNILNPDVSTETNGMGKDEYGEVVRKILDNLSVFPTEEDKKKGTNLTNMPRLGFEYAPLRISIRIDRATGRMLPPLGFAIHSDEHPVKPKDKYPVTIESPSLGETARHHLAKALAIRLSKRDYLGQGRSVVLKPSAILGNEEVGEITLDIPPYQPKEYDLYGNVWAEMARAWDCTKLTMTPEYIDYGPREFGRMYWMDRDKALKRNPENSLYMSKEDEDGTITMDLPCPTYMGGFKIGDFHTHAHPETDPPEIDDKDKERAVNCGNQHYIIADTGVFRYFSDGTPIKVSASLPYVKCQFLDHPPQ